MKKISSFILIAVLIVAPSLLTGCRNNSASTANPSSSIPNPIKEYASVAEVNKALGFDMIPLPSNFQFIGTAYETINDKIGQLTYAKPSTEETGEIENTSPKKSAVNENAISITVRMAKGDEDITGIYGVNYGEETIKNIDINIGVYKNTTYIAWWVYNDMSYSITAYNMDSSMFNSIVEAFINEMLA